jgi:hypothetical protein
MNQKPWYLHQLTQNELKTFVSESRAEKSNKRAYIGTVISAASQKIEVVCGKKVSKIMLESGAIRHAYKKSNHNLRDDDLLNLVYAINTATETNIKVSDKTHQNNECLEISKEIDGEIIFVMEVRIHYGGWLSLVTCYRKNRGGATL